MNIKELSEACQFSFVNVPFPDREVKGAYCGDLLSWVMGRVQADEVWMTIMTNVNILAVASLADVACILLTEGTALPEEVLAVAREKEINILSTDLATYEAAVKVSQLLS